MSVKPAPWGAPPPAPKTAPAGPDDWRNPAASSAETGPALPPGAHRVALAYHRLGHADARHAWWKPLLEGFLLIVLFVVASIIFTLAFMLVAGESVDLDGLLDANQLDPPVFYFLFASVALMLPAALLARLITGPRPLGLLLSVTGRIRWRWLLRCGLVALGLYVVLNTAALVLDPATLRDGVDVQVVPGFWWLLLGVVLIVPLQCAAEELVFRGYLAQAFGTWLKHPAWAILLPVPIFVAGHVYDVWGLSAVAIMGITMGVVTWRTGGLEAAIAVHTVNNAIVTLTGMLGLADMNDTEGGPLDVVLTALINGLYIWLVFRMVRARPEVAVTRTVVQLPRPERGAPFPQGAHGGAWPAAVASPGGAPLPPLHERPAALARDDSGFAVHVLDPRTRSYLSLPPEYGPYTVLDGSGRVVGVADPRGAGAARGGGVARDGRGAGAPVESPPHSS